MWDDETTRCSEVANLRENLNVKQTRMKNLIKPRKIKFKIRVLKNWNDDGDDVTTLNGDDDIYEIPRVMS